MTGKLVKSGNERELKRFGVEGAEGAQIRTAVMIITTEGTGTRTGIEGTMMMAGDEMVREIGGAMVIIKK